MLYYGSKILQQFAYPFNLALIAFAICLFYLLRREPQFDPRRRKSERLSPGEFHRRTKRSALRWLIAALVLLVVPSIPIVGDTLLIGLELDKPSSKIEQYPRCDAIVVLGGTALPPRPPRREAEEAGGSRLLKAARLFKAGKAPIVLVSGGGTYSLDDGSERAEADDMADVLIAMGVPADKIVKQRESRTTYEDAVYSSGQLEDAKIKSVLLVTSAFHMRRSVALFRKQGVDVIPAPSGYLAAGDPIDGQKFIPTAQGITRTTIAIKEYVGYLAYRTMGKL